MKNHQYVENAKHLVLEKEKLPMPRKPRGDVLDWPRSVGDLSQEDLAEHLTVWTAWAGYTRGLLASASANQVAYESQQGIFKSKEMIRQEGDHKTVTAMKAAVESSEEFLECEENATQSRVNKKILESLLVTYENRRDVISREITRRSKEFDEHNSKRMT